MSDNNPPVDNAIRTWPGPVVHLRQPGDRVTIVLEPEPVAALADVLDALKHAVQMRSWEQVELARQSLYGVRNLAEQPAPYPAELMLPVRLRVTGSLPVYDAPEGQILRQASVGGQIDVYEQRGAWWRVTQPPVREMWVRAARLVE